MSRAGPGREGVLGLAEWRFELGRMSIQQSGQKTLILYHPYFPMYFQAEALRRLPVYFQAEALRRLPVYFEVEALQQGFLRAEALQAGALRARSLRSCR